MWKFSAPDYCQARQANIDDRDSHPHIAKCLWENSCQVRIQNNGPVVKFHTFFIPKIIPFPKISRPGFCSSTKFADVSKPRADAAADPRIPSITLLACEFHPWKTFTFQKKSWELDQTRQAWLRRSQKRLNSKRVAASYQKCSQVGLYDQKLPNKRITSTSPKPDCRTIVPALRPARTERLSDTRFTCLICETSFTNGFKRFGRKNACKKITQNVPRIKKTDLRNVPNIIQITKKSKPKNFDSICVHDRWNTKSPEATAELSWFTKISTRISGHFGTQNGQNPGPASPSACNKQRSPKCKLQMGPQLSTKKLTENDSSQRKTKTPGGCLSRSWG